MARGSYAPRMIVTDKLASYGSAHAEVIPAGTHLRRQCSNNRAENAHQPTRARNRCARKWGQTPLKWKKMESGTINGVLAVAEFSAAVKHIVPPRDTSYRWEGHGSGPASVLNHPPDERATCFLLLLKMVQRPCQITPLSYVIVFFPIYKRRRAVANLRKRQV